MLQRQSWIVETESTWPPKPKIHNIWPFKKKLANPDQEFESIYIPNSLQFGLRKKAMSKGELRSLQHTLWEIEDSKGWNMARGSAGNQLKCIWVNVIIKDLTIWNCQANF